MHAREWQDHPTTGAPMESVQSRITPATAAPKQ
jgi:hypothetical protein